MSLCPHSLDSYSAPNENFVLVSVLTVAAVIGAVNKLESSVIPLLASPQGGVAASSRKFRAGTEADAAGVVLLLFSSENHPGLAISGGFAIIF